MSTKVINVRNVNEALARLVQDIYYLNPETGGSLLESNEDWRWISPRGMPTLEHVGTVVTEYRNPTERVLFSADRDAHPFFHFMESLWILDGRRDVAWIDRYLSSLKKYSDDGRVYHAAYGYRMRSHFKRIWEEQGFKMGDPPIPHVSPVDQLTTLVKHLRNDPDSRRAVMSFWDPAEDLDTVSKDIPCNDLLMFKLRDNKLDLTVCCRSNDAVWGAYGTNAVQFSMILEFVAGALGVNVGIYRQVSDSFHIYKDNEAWDRLMAKPEVNGRLSSDPYCHNKARPYPLFRNVKPHEHLDWLAQLRIFMHGQHPSGPMFPFFQDVAYPMKAAWDIYKDSDDQGRFKKAIEFLRLQCHAVDWRIACEEWLLRRAAA